MESRVKKLLNLLETTRSSEAAHLAAFQLGEVSKDLFGHVVKHLVPVLLHSEESVRNYAALTLHCCIVKSEVRALSESTLKKPCTDYDLDALLVNLQEALQDRKWEVKHGALLGLNVLFSEVEVPSCLHETLLDEIIQVLKVDRISDYSSDMPLFPVREVAAKALTALVSKGEISEVEQRLSRLVLEADDCLGPLMALRQLKSSLSFTVLPFW